MDKNKISPFGYTTFDKKYPEIDDIAITVEEESDEIHPRAATKTYFKNQLGDSIPCRNSLCSNLGISVSEIIENMVNNRETEKDDYKQCRGSEKQPRRSCYNHFKINTKIKYKVKVKDDNFQEQ